MMKLRLYRSIFLFFCSAALLGSGRGSAAGTLPSASTGGVTLLECHQKAIQVSETLSISSEEIRQLEAQYRQGVGSILPDVSWQRTDFWQDTPTGTIYINYAPATQVQRILAAGKADRTAGGEGPFAGIKVGVPTS